MEPGVIRDGGIGIGGVVVVPATSFCVGLGLLPDLEGFLVAVTAIAVVTPATVSRRVGGGGRERRR